MGFSPDYQGVPGVTSLPKRGPQAAGGGLSTPLAHDWLLVDVGGTNISHRIRGLTRQQRTPRTKATCLALIQSWITDYQPAGFALAVPGLLDRGVVTPGSAANLSDIPGDWDGFDWHRWLARMGQAYRVINDALAALLGSVIHHHEGWISERPVMVGYIGPGTGLGGGFVSAKTGYLTVIGDGHLYDVWLPRDPDDAWRTGDRVLAEDVLSGRGYEDVMGRSLADGEHPPLYIELMGRYLRGLVRCLQSGYPIPKRGPAWSRETCEWVSQTRHWILGGGILGHDAIRQCVMAHWPPEHQVTVLGSSIHASLDGLSALQTMGDGWLTVM